jgi:hypothetical protein
VLHAELLEEPCGSLDVALELLEATEDVSEALDDVEL